MRERPEVVAYNAGFEARCLEHLAEAVPKLRKPLRAIRSRLVDPLPIVRDHVYHPAFRGGFGLKAVLPALAYDDLDIAGGDAASTALEALHLAPDSIAAPERGTLRKQLLAYCERDTLALVKLTERLRQMAT